MSIRRTVARAASAAALVAPLLLSAQDTTRVSPATSASRQRDSVSRARATSQQRIRVQKEANGEVVISRDAAALARADSLARAERERAEAAAVMERQRVTMMEERARADSMARADSIARIERIRQDSVDASAAALRAATARADSIANAEQLRRQRMRDRYMFNGTGWYIGLSGGGAMPTGDFSDLGYDRGVNVNVPIGWHSRSHLLGVRLDLGYSQFGSGSFTGNGAGSIPVTLNNSDPKVFSAAFDVTAQVPLNASRSLSLYALGGGGLYHFQSFGARSSLGGFLGNDVLDATDASFKTTRNKLGAQVGAGLDFGLGPASIFLESRLVNVFADRNDNVRFSDFFGANRSKNLRWVPILLGVNFR